MSGDERPFSSRIGAYRIERELGRGGMAFVYQAEDPDSPRQVAIKVLRPELSHLLGQRFLREIAVLSTLQHPYIVPLLHAGAHEGQLYFVMPLVRGESLRERLTRERQLPVGDALRIAREVADALAYAHREGVVHRDIKPENILLSGAHVQVADFGIAKAMLETGGESLTRTGVVIGTAEYMSPEQAAGERSLDGRSDVYSLGCVLFEMLAGRPPFTGPTAESVIHQHMVARPVTLGQLGRVVPVALEEVVARALAKAPADRFPTADAFGAALDAAPLERPRTRPGRRTAAVVAAAALATAGVSGASAWLTRGAQPVAEFGEALQVTAEDGLEIAPSLSPDGITLAYTAGLPHRMRVYLRPVKGGRIVPLTDDSGAYEFQPRWSPDGSQLLYLTWNELRIASPLGGTSRIVAADKSADFRWRPTITAAAWSPDGSEIFVVRGRAMSILRLADGRERSVGRSTELLYACDWSPTQPRVACAFGNFLFANPGRNFGNLGGTSLALVSLATGAVQPIQGVGAMPDSPTWSRDGRRLYFASNLHGPRDAYALEVGADGVPRLPPSRLTTGLNAHTISLSAGGRHLAYVNLAVRSNIWSLPLSSETGDPPPQPQAVTSGTQIIHEMRVTPDGRWLLFDSNRHGTPDLYRMPIAGGDAERLTSDTASEFSADLSPDGREFVYYSTAAGSRDIYVRSLEDGTVQQVTSSPAHEMHPVWSPDGRAIAFSARQAGTGVELGVFVTRRDGSGAWSTPVRRRRGATRPAWLSARELAYQVGRAVERVHVDSGRPYVLLEKPEVTSQGIVLSASRDTAYYRSSDEEGRASFWAASLRDGRTRLLARLTDPRRTTTGPVAVGAGRLFFTIDEWQSDVWVMDLMSR
jgi:Tol biopolymer transport system component